MSDGAGTATVMRDDGPDRPSRPVGKKSDGGPGRIRSIGTFYKQVVAELRKVIWPTRKELIAYTTVVVVFVLVMIVIVAILDFFFGQGVLKVFGDSSL